MTNETSNKKIDAETGTETTGHVWDGIEELNTPLPRWWLWTFYATIIWGLGYVILYPAWPLVSGATPGLLGYSTRAEVAADIARVETQNAPMNAALVATPVAALQNDPALMEYATSAGASVFGSHCSQCHGAGAAGSKGYPNLRDDDWLWGGDSEAILATIRHGIRSDQDTDTRYSEMPAFGDFLSESDIQDLVMHVLSLSDQGDPSRAGADLYAENCAACHGDAALGDREQGAPNLSDAIWLYGADPDTLTQTITHGRFGVMPAWGTRLSEAELRAVTAYVHDFGGGETDEQ